MTDSDKLQAAMLHLQEAAAHLHRAVDQLLPEHFPELRFEIDGLIEAGLTAKRVNDRIGKIREGKLRETTAPLAPGSAGDEEDGPL
jgi:hypothetical protein